MDNKKYLEGLFKKDNAVLRQIYMDFFDRIKALIIKNGGTVDDAKDVFQDALTIIFQKVQSPDFELNSSFYTFLYSICKFSWYEKKRKKVNQSVTLDYDESLIDNNDIEQAIYNNEMDKVYRENFVKLSVFCQQLFRLFFAKEKMDKIAEKLDLKNAHTARNRKYRCHQDLITLMKDDERYHELRNQN